MAARNPLVSAMRKEAIGGARGALRRLVDSRLGKPRFQEAAADRAREVDRLLARRMRAAKRSVEFERHVGSDREAAGMETGSDDGVKRGTFDALTGELLDGERSDPNARATPAGVEERTVAAIGRDDRHGGAVGRGDRDPRVTGAHHESVGLGSRFGGRYESGAVDLAQERRRRSGVTDRGPKRLAIHTNRRGIVADAETDVERGVRTATPSSESGRHAEPRSGREGAGWRTPERKGQIVRWMRWHGPEGARRAENAQANCTVCALALLLLAGCARVPVSTSGADARTRLLAHGAEVGGPVRGVGDIEADIAGRGGSFEARWGSAGESLVVIGYSGPIRVLDAALLRDSVYVAIRPQEFGVAGLVRPEQGFGADGLRFLLRPWDFGPAWIREALERASADAIEGGWRLRGRGEAASGTVTFALDITSRGEPRRLELARADDPRIVAVVRYGALRRFAAGRYPRWIEWSRDDARVRLDVREIGDLPGGRLRLLPPASFDWRVVSLNDPEGVELLGRLIGAPSKEVSR